jgi:hypothetical protein
MHHIDSPDKTEPRQVQQMQRVTNAEASINRQTENVLNTDQKDMDAKAATAAYISTSKPPENNFQVICECLAAIGLWLKLMTVLRTILGTDHSYGDCEQARAEAPCLPRTWQAEPVAAESEPSPLLPEVWLL